MWVVFRTIEPEEFDRAFAWHMTFAKSNDLILPRPQTTFARLISTGRVWCATSASGEYQAMSYITDTSACNEWEFGGLMVHESMRGKGVGRIMLRLPISYMLVVETFYAFEQRFPKIITHVHRDNPAPRKVIHELFKLHGRISLLAKDVPGLRADKNGLVWGDEFHFMPLKSVRALSNWCASWTGKLSDNTPATIESSSLITFEYLAEALSSIAKSLATKTRK